MLDTGHRPSEMVLAQFHGVKILVNWEHGKARGLFFNIKRGFVNRKFGGFVKTHIRPWISFGRLRTGLRENGRDGP